MRYGSLFPVGGRWRSYMFLCLTSVSVPGVFRAPLYNICCVLRVVWDLRKMGGGLGSFRDATVVGCRHLVRILVGHHGVWGRSVCLRWKTTSVRPLLSYNKIGYPRGI